MFSKSAANRTLSALFYFFSTMKSEALGVNEEMPDAKGIIKSGR